MNLPRRYFLTAITLIATGASLEAGPPPANPEPSAPSPTALRLVDLIEARLEFAPRIAWIKYRKSQPIADLDREAELLADVAASPSARGLPAGIATDFVAAQMRASRILQSGYTRAWSRGGTLPAVEPLDLGTEIRPELDLVTADLLDALAAMRRSDPQSAESRATADYAFQRLRQAGFPWNAVRAATAPLR